MLTELEVQLKTALLARDSATVNTLKLLKSALLLEAKGEHELSETDQLNIVRKQIKMRQDAAESFAKAGNPDKAALELAEAALLEKFLPAQMTLEELEAVVDKVIADEQIALEPKNMGLLIGAVSKQAGDKASKADIAQIVKSKLN